jgi:hypothetical protein
MLYSPDTDIQRFCRWCQLWYHVKCLAGELEENQVQERLTYAQDQLPDMDGDAHLLALLPIQRGCGNVVGPIKHIMEVFGQNSANVGDNHPHVESWEDTPMYACPSCEHGFL